MYRIVCLVAAIVSFAVVAGASADAKQAIGATKFDVSLTGPGGTGNAALKLGPGGKVCYFIEVHLTTPGDFPKEPAPGLGNAHLHVLPSGGIAVHLDTTFTDLGGGNFVSAGCVRADKDVVRTILANPEDYYVNVHTVAFPGGAVSGTLA